MEKKKISITCACYNEVTNIRQTYDELINMLKRIPEYDYEIIFGDNYSTDGTRDILRQIAKEDKNVKVIFNATNFGVSRSGKNLLRHVTGDVFISVPADLQEPIEMLPDFIEYWEQGYDIVWGVKESSDENPIKYFCRTIYYNIIDFFSDYPQLHQTTGFGVTDRHVLDLLLELMLQDSDISLRHLISEYGFKIKLLPYNQRKRKSGSSSYNAYRYYSFAITSLCSTSVKPMRLLTVGGGTIGVTCIFISLLYLIYKLTHWSTFSAGIAPVMIGLFFCSGILMFSVGILGEYITLILRRVTRKPLVVEEEVLNMDEIQNDK